MIQRSFNLRKFLPMHRHVTCLEFGSGDGGPVIESIRSAAKASKKQQQKHQQLVKRLTLSQPAPLLHPKFMHFLLFQEGSQANFAIQGFEVSQASAEIAEGTMTSVGCVHIYFWSRTATRIVQPHHTHNDVHRRSPSCTKISPLPCFRTQRLLLQQILKSTDAASSTVYQRAAFLREQQPFRGTLQASLINPG